MRGELGTLNIDGRQIGGFLNWQIDIYLKREASRCSKRYGVQFIRVRADKYWMLEIPEANIVDAIFYVLFHDELMAVSQNKVRINLAPDVPLNKILDKRLGMVWMR